MKSWGALIHRMITKQQLKREQSYPVCLYAVEKSEKVESVNTQNDYETTSKKMNRSKENKLVLCVM